MNESNRYIFYGDPNKRPIKSHLDSPKEQEPYVASEDLIQAVNLALFLRRPLLMEGEAGCGKTRLARAVAYELGLPFYTWYVKSTSKVQDGLYAYDAILRLHDVQVQQFEKKMDNHPGAKINQLRDPRNPKDYRRFGPIGKAFEEKEFSSVILIDEIDKADIDFPNDLLSILDDPWEFEIPETGEIISASKEYKPIVIITSNKEKGNLPAPFLRRCIYFYVDFPDEERLEKIVEAHQETKKSKKVPDQLLKKAINHFLKFRNEEGLHKNPGTSEFLDWLSALNNFVLPKSKEKPQISEDWLKKIPYPELLFKLRIDWLKYAMVK